VTRLLAELARDRRGAIQVEYVILLTLVALVASVAIAGLAVPLIQFSQSVTTAITSPMP
jgi:Flp pilus assembly pilin Flp